MKRLFAALLLSFPMYAQPIVYPLSIGDRWQYSYFIIPNPYPSGYSVRVASDTVMPNGETYIQLIYSDNLTRDFVRQSGDSVLLYDRGLHAEILYFDFSRLDHDTVSSTARGTDTMDIVLTSVLTGTYWGRSLRLWIFSVNPSRRAIDDEFSLYVADSLGIVRKVPGFGDPAVLTGAIVNGTKYGTIDKVNTHEPPEQLNFSLHQNFPNPFNPTTTIRFALPVSAQVTMEVLNSLGQRLLLRKYSQLQAGEHSVLFDGSKLPSGVYYYRVNAMANQQVGKMILQK